MSGNQNIRVNLTDPTAARPDDGYWLTINDHERKDDSFVSMGEAADFIDQLFDLTPCEPQEQVGGDAAPDEPEMTEDEYLTQAQEWLSGNADMCQARDGSYECDIRVARSHQDEDYLLKLDNGEIVQTVKIEETKTDTLVLDDESSYTLQTPIIGTPKMAWQGKVFDRRGEITPPTIEVIGSTLFFGKVVTGTVKIVYDTVYDIVTIEVYGLDNANALTNPDADPLELQSCNVLAFYHNMVFAHTISPPEITEKDEAEKDKLCGEDGSSVTTSADSVSCYDIVNMITRCKCSGAEVSRVTNEVDVDCPASVKHCPNGKETCRALRQTYSVDAAYIRCPAEENLEGSVSDPDYYILKCCESNETTGVPLPSCKIQTGVFSGGKGVSEAAKATYPDAVFIGVGPERGPCGTKTTTYNVGSSNCCEGVEAISYDIASSVQVLDRNDSGVVFIDGSANDIEKKWFIHGQGFWLNSGHDKKYLYTTSDTITVFTDNTACGTALVGADDGCSTDHGHIKCSYGVWLERCDSQDGLGHCCSSGSVWETEAVISTGVFEGFSGEMRIREYVTCDTTVGGGLACTPSGGDSCCSWYGQYSNNDYLWPACTGSGRYYIQDSLTPCGTEYCASMGDRCAWCDDKGGMYQPSGIYVVNFPFKPTVTRSLMWEWVCE